MNARLAAISLSLALLTPAAHARRRAALVGPRAQVLFVRDVAAGPARAQLRAGLAALDACLQAVPPEYAHALSQVGRAFVTLELDAQGAPRAVAVDPSLSPTALSRCLSDALWTWRQPGRVGRRPLVHLVVRLTP